MVIGFLNGVLKCQQITHAKLELTHGLVTSTQPARPSQAQASPPYSYEWSHNDEDQTDTCWGPLFDDEKK